MSEVPTSSAVPDTPKPAPAPKKKVHSPAPKEVKKPSGVLIPVGAFLVGVLIASVFAYFIAGSKELAVNKASAEASKEIAVCEASLKSTKAALTPIPVATAHSVDFQPVIGKVEEICGPKQAVVEKTHARTKTRAEVLANAEAKARAFAAQQRPSPTLNPVVTGHVSRSDNIWYWRENTATDQKPGRCIFSSGNGEGKPPFCATFSIVGQKQGETESAWIGRVGGGGRVEIDPLSYQKK